MASDYDQAMEAERTAFRLWTECKEEAKRPRPAPTPRAPMTAAPAGMPPNPCADLRARYEEAKRALDLAQARNADDLARAQAGLPAMPPFLSDGGRDVFRSIENLQDAMSILPGMIAIGTAISAGETLGVGSVVTGGHDLTDTVDAMATIPLFERNRIKEFIDLHVATMAASRKKMDKREADYWQAVRARL